MKTVLLFFASLFTATAWATPFKPLALFAKVNDTLMPLSGTRLSEYENISALSYEDPSAVPAEFKLTEDNYAYGPNQEAIGFIEPLIVFGNSVNPVPLQMDKDNKILNGRFYSCKVAAHSKVHKIFYDLESLYRTNCFEVDIFLLPHKPKVQQVIGKKRHQAPISFKKTQDFANSNNKVTFSPSNRLSHRNDGFRHGYGSEALYFPPKDGHTISTERSRVDNAMNYGNPPSSLSPNIRWTNSKLANVKRVHPPYHFGSSGHGMYTPTDNKVSTHYYEEVIYYHYESNTEAVTQDPRYTLFAKVGEAMIPLGARHHFEDGDHFSSMCYGTDIGEPIKFKLDGHYGLSVETSYSGYLGLRHRVLSFGPNIPPTGLMLDENMRLRNANYFSCESPDVARVITTQRFEPSCFSVKIYLLRHEEIVSKASMHEVFERKTNVLLGRKKLMNSRNEVSLGKSGSSLSPVTRSLPYTLYAKVNGSLLPLGSRPHKREDVQYSIMCYGPNVSEPIEFQMEGSSAISVNTPMDGYLGIYDHVLAFGRGITAADLMLDDDRRLRNADYLSCLTFTGYYGISTIQRFLPCEPVEIYLLNNITEAVTDMKGVPLPEKENSSDDDEVSLRQDKKSHPKPLTSDYDYVLFVQLGATLQPLGSRHYIYQGNHYNAMCYGPQCSEPVFFEIVDEFATSLYTEYDGYLAIVQRMLTFGPENPPTDLMLDEDMRLRNADYFSCDNHITSDRLFAACFKVKLYLLHPDAVIPIILAKNAFEERNAFEDRNAFWNGKTSVFKKNPFWKNALGKNAFGKDENQVFSKEFPGKDMMFVKNPESKPPSVTQDFQYLIYAKRGGVMTPLGSRTYAFYDGYYSVICYGSNCGEPVKFSLVGTTAMSMGTPHNGYLGILSRTLAFSPTFYAMDLMLDENMRVCNAIYFSCLTFTNIEVITIEHIYDDCFEVELYFIQQPNTAAAKDRIDVPGKVHKARKAKIPETEKTNESDTEEPAMAKPRPKAPPFDPDLDLDEDTPYAVFVNINDIKIPLSAKLVPYFGFDVSVMYYDIDHGTPAPAQFVLEDGEYALSFGAPINGYLGVCDEVFAFGPNMPRGRLVIDSTGTLKNTKFYSCWCDPVNARVISIERLNEACFDVDIYILPLNPNPFPQVTNMR